MRSQTQTNLTAIVLAGGRSSRMGQDKALMSIGHQPPLLQQVCQVAQQCTDVVYVVTPWVERYQPLLNALDAIPPIHLIQEQLLSEDDLMHGPLVGFAQGLVPVTTDWVLLLACDLPNLRVEPLQQAATLLPTVSAETMALLFKNPSGWWEALCGFYRRQSLDKLEPFIQQGGRSFQRWLSQETVQELPLTDPQMLFNCNTPADVERVKQQF
jgi:molybdenum cofactor guanylyltransferase